MKRINQLLAALCVSPFLAQAALATAINNADIIKLLEARMPEDVVLQAIANGQPSFDTSAAALIAMKEKGASPRILKAVLQPSEAANKGYPNAPNSTAASAYNPEEVTLIVDSESTIMQYIIPQQRTAARVLGLGGFATFAVLRGASAQRRVSPTPEFIVSVPKNAQVNNYLTLAHFAVRSSQTREVLTGSGYMSYSTGITKSRVIAVHSEALPDQSAAREGFVLYKVTPEKQLKRGEYALVLYTGEMRMPGFFAQAANSYYDFGVD